MVWKLLSGIAAACLAGSSYFAWVNSQQVKTEKELLARAETNQQQLMDRKKEAGEAQERKAAQLAQLEKDRDDTKEEVVKATAEAQEKEGSLALLKSNLDQVMQQVTTLDAKIRDAGDIQALIDQIAALKKDEQSAEGEVANKDQQLAQAQQRLQALRDQVRSFEQMEERIRRGIVEPDFNARVTGVFGTWGFVVLNKGNNGGVFANALLDVKRGQDVIAKLRVKNVEPAISVADVLEGSLAEGEAIRSGDLVVAAPDQPAVSGGNKPAAPATAAGGAQPAISTEPPPAAMPAPASDPFGSAPAPAMDGGAAPAPASDPFGSAPAPAMDGGAAPAPASDPFGSAPAPTTPPATGGMTSDPFGN